MGDGFDLTVEVVPPASGNAETILSVLRSLAGLPNDGFSVASNPVAKPLAGRFTNSGECGGVFSAGLDGGW